MEDRYEFREEIRLWLDELLGSNKTFDDIGNVIRSFERDSRTLTKQQKNLIARELDTKKYQSLLSSSDDLDDEEMFPKPKKTPGVHKFLGSPPKNHQGKKSRWCWLFLLSRCSEAAFLSAQTVRVLFRRKRLELHFCHSDCAPLVVAVLIARVNTRNGANARALERL